MNKEKDFMRSLLDTIVICIFALFALTLIALAMIAWLL